MTVRAILQEAASLCFVAVVYGSYMTSHHALSSLSGQNCQQFSTCHQPSTAYNQSESDVSLDTQDTGKCCVYCSCNPDVCSDMGDCCPGIRPRKPESQSESVVHCHALQNNLGSDEEASHQILTNYIDSVGIYMVTNCPNNTRNPRCDSPDVNSFYENLPQSEVSTGRVYRNIFCGMCNGVTEMTPWTAYVKCSHKYITKSDVMLFPISVDRVFGFVASLKDSSCGIYFQPPANVQNTADLCFLNRQTLGNECSQENGDTSGSTDCNNNNQTYVIPPSYCCDNTTGSSDNCSSILETNAEHCNTTSHTDAIPVPSCCDNGTGSSEDCSVVLEDRAELSPEEEFIGRLNTAESPSTESMPHWTQTDMTHASLIPATVSCNDSYVYDPYQEKCRRWYCPNGRHLVGSDCVPVFANVVRAKKSVSLEMFPDEASLRQFKAVNKTDLVHDVLDDMFGSDVHREVVIIGMKKDLTILYTFVLLTISEDSDTRLRLYNASTFGRDRFIPGPNGTMNINVDFASGIKIEMWSFFLTDIIIIDLKTYKSYLNVYRANFTEIEEAMSYSAIGKMTFCTQILLDDSEIRDYVDIIDIRVSDIRLRIGDFQKEVAQSGGGDGIRVCLSDYLQRAKEHLLKTPKAVVYSPQAILSVICNMLSMAGLLVTLVTYVIFDELRSIPGKNNIMLALHLLIAQCLYQFGMDQTETPTLCIILGVFIHLFWLTAIFWMNACTLHMFRTFVTGQSYRSVRALDPQVCCYALYCYGVAVAMVSINLGVSLYRSKGHDYGYGGHVCYISDPVMVGWVFALPVGVIIILNMGFFFAVVYQISASTMRRRGKSTDRTNTVIYMKLSSLTGVTWIFGYLYMWTNFEVLEYIFIVLNAGQGVLIFISFICTKRILKLYWNFFRKHTRSCRASACLCVRKSPVSETNGVDVNTAKISLTGTSSSKGMPMTGRFSTREWRRNKKMQQVVLNRNFSTGHSCNSCGDSSDIFQDSMNIAKHMSTPPAADGEANGTHRPDRAEEHSSVVKDDARGGENQHADEEKSENIATICLHQLDMVICNQ